MKECSNSISIQCAKKILEQMNNSIYKINENNGKFDIGFFCHIKYKNKDIPVLITNNQHIYLAKNNYLKISINKENKLIELGKTRYFNKLYDLSIIEIKENKNDKIYFLEIDEKLYETDSDIKYNNQPIYIIHYHNKDIYSTFGTTKDLNCSKIFYWCNSNLNLYFKNCPIFNLSNNKLIGVSKEKSHLYNSGLFFGFVIKEFINEYNISKHDINNNYCNEIDIIVNVEKCEINKEIFFIYNSLHKDEYKNELNELNTELYINDKKQEYKRYFVPEKEGDFKIKLKFNENITDSSYMFADCENIININFKRFNTKYIKNMKYMFYNCKRLKNIIKLFLLG